MIILPWKKNKANLWGGGICLFAFSKARQPDEAENCLGHCFLGLL